MYWCEWILQLFFYWPIHGFYYWQKNPSTSIKFNLKGQSTWSCRFQVFLAASSWFQLILNGQGASVGYCCCSSDSNIIFLISSIFINFSSSYKISASFMHILSISGPISANIMSTYNKWKLAFNIWIEQLDQSD